MSTSRRCPSRSARPCRRGTGPVHHPDLHRVHRRADAADRPRGGRCAARARLGALPGLLPVRDGAGGADAPGRAALGPHRRRGVPAADHRPDVPDLPAGAAADSGGARDIRADRGGAPRRAHADPGFRRPRRPRPLHEPHGRRARPQDPAAGEPVAGAAAVRLRREPRAPDAADDRPHGRRRALRRARGVRRGDPPLHRAAQGGAGPVRVAAHRAARDQPLRCRRRRTPGRRRRPGLAGRRRGRRPAAPRRRQRHPPCPGRPRGGALPRRPAPGAADHLQPAQQRHRARRGARRGAHHRGQPDRGRRHRARPRGRLQRRAGPPGLHPVLAGRPVPPAHRRRLRPRPVDRPRGRPAARRLAQRVGASGPRGPVPAHPAPGRGRGGRESPLPVVPAERRTW